MSERKYRLARQEAYKEAVRQKLWDKGMKEFYSRLWRRIISWLFPKTKKRYSDFVGRWYKRTLKIWAKSVYEYQHDPDVREFERARRKVNRKYMRGRVTAH